LIVQRILKSGPSDAAGVDAGDIITSVEGQAVAGQIDFYRKMWSLGGGWHGNRVDRPQVRLWG
tara:strand:+ start:151 stop:339 length:189 start_codon:yes stop_codon:yes gene_type:complete